MTRDEAWGLLTEYNQDPFHLKHAQIVEGVMRYFAKELFRLEADAGAFHWIAGEAPAGPVHCRVKLRYHQPEQEATVYPRGAEAVHIRFRQPQRAIAPGQADVLYDGDRVLGGGTLL